ncbi:MAG: PLP-dependent aminotransferase family protein [Chloroflexi bacterium]|nr:PLP-dependent aminotransferase family protein [Chloroflexota bacterium]
MHKSFPTIQLSIKPGVIDLAWGQPDPKLLPVADMQRASELALKEYGADALAYGADAGAGPLLDYLAKRIERNERRTLTHEQIMLTGGNSDALDQICTHFTAPGDTVLVEAPTYHLAVRILRDHHLDVIAVPTDQDGLRVKAFQQTLVELKRAGKHPKFLYTIPTFHNPTGANLSEGRRRGLAKVAEAERILLVEDDVYRELAYDAPAPPSLWSMAPEGGVLRMGSFAKALAPGLRLGWMTGKGEHIQRMATGGLRDSGGGVNHFTAMTIAAFCEAGMYDAQIEKLRKAYRERRDALCDALPRDLPQARFEKPGGGFFVWGNLPESVDTQGLRARAQEHNVDFIHGARFFIDGRRSSTFRVAFSLYPPEELQEAIRRLRRAMAV